MVTLKGLPYHRLREYLLHHEQDIAHGMNDFGDLRELFHLIMDAWPDNKIPEKARCKQCDESWHWNASNIGAKANAIYCGDPFHG